MSAPFSRILSAFERLKLIYSTVPESRSQIAERVNCLLLDINQPTRGPERTTEPMDHTRSANELERKRVDARLNGFVYKESRAWHEITRHYGDGLNQAELLSLAEVLASQIGIKVDREAKRRKEVLIKWYDENIDTIVDIMPRIKLEDKDGKPVEGIRR